MAVQSGQEQKVEQLETPVVEAESPTKDSPSYNHATETAKVDYSSLVPPLKLCMGVRVLTGTNSRLYIAYGEVISRTLLG